MLVLLADRLNLIQPSPSIGALSRARDLISSGRDVCNMAGGEPEFATPPHIVEAAHRAMLDGQTRYTAVDGTRALKEAICAKFWRENGLRVEPSEVSVGAGAKQVIFNALTCSVQPGDEVIVPAPYWVSYPDVVRLNGAKPIFIETDYRAGFKVTPTQLQEAITPRTKWLILNSPNNPTGATYGYDELRAIGAVIEANPQIHVLTDDIYEHLRYDEAPFTTFAKANPDLADRTLTINGVSKTYAMTGWRIGYCAGPKSLIKAMETMQSQNSGNPASVSQAAALAALDGPLDFLPNWIAEYRMRRDLLVSRLDGQYGLRCPTPQGAFYVYVSCEAQMGKRTAHGSTVETDSDFVIHLLEHGVAGVQGAAYGLPPAFRLSFTPKTETVQKAIDRILQACAVLR
ncbi:pyridoxal phosphate-dependent aminotransferase [Bradyrhizobium sp. 151]|uniref:pyridoxal phosphate-dependent aminotransferase n=1 Tax=Bradyrhizobium sp. 151 TaxID=2782626 RepID=UPI001FF8B6D5|nr:pyridoxal phosphate-dependent aminotransferase [Bradyrhizobium sp. 151]